MTLVKQRSTYLLTYWYTFFILLLAKLKILNFCVKLKAKKDFQIFEGANILERILGARHTSPHPTKIGSLDEYLHAKKSKRSIDSFQRFC